MRHISCHFPFPEVKSLAILTTHNDNFRGTTHVIMKKEHIDVINSLEDAFRYSNYLSLCVYDKGSESSYNYLEH